MGRMIDELKAFVDEQTQDLGVVSNLHGVIDSAEVQETDRKPQGWYVGQVMADSPPDLNALLQAFTYEKPPVETVDANDVGVAQYPASGSTIPVGRAVFFLGVARVPATRSLVLRVRAEGATISIFVDGLQVGTGLDNVRVAPELSQGDHAVTVIVHGTTKPVTVEASSDIEIVRSDLVPAAPVWHAAPMPYLMDPSNTTMASRLRWNNGSHASAWNLYRHETQEIGCTKAAAVPTVDAEGMLTFILDQPVTLQENAWLFTQYFEIGRVVSVAGAGQGETAVTVAPSLVAEPDLNLWEDLRVFQALETSTAIATIPNAGESLVQYDDTGVRIDAVYLYRVTAVGPLGLSESAYSDFAWVWTNDEEPPLGIDWDVANPPEVIYEGYNIVVKYLSPPDLDFAGVRVYGPYPLSQFGDIDPPPAFSPDEMVKEKRGTSLKRDQVSFRVQEDQPDSFYQIATFDFMGNEQRPNSFVIRRTGENRAGAYALIWDGPVDSVYGINTSIEMDIDLTDNRNTETQTVLILKTFPRAATVKTWVDRVLLDLNATKTVGPRTYPALTELTTQDTDDHRKYEVVLQEIEGKTVEFIATTKGTPTQPMRPFTLTYRLDADPFPGISGVHVEDRRAYPTIWVTMDDDAKWLRLVDVTSGQDVILYRATKTPGTDGPLIDYNTILMKYIHATPLLANEQRLLRVDASKDGTSWRLGVWNGSMRGPEFIPPGIRMDVDVNPDTNGVMVHTVNISVTPTNALVDAVIVRDNGQVSDTIDLDPADDGQDTFKPKYMIGTQTPIPGRYECKMVRDPDYDLKFIATATINDVDQSAVYTLDRDYEPGAFVSVENTRPRPIITAIMDDDANALRIQKETRDSNGNVTLVEDVTGGFVYRGQTDNVTLKWQPSADMTVDEVAYYRVEASKENVATPSEPSWVLAWQGALQGPHPNTTTASITVDASIATVGTVEEHTLTLTVRPKELSVVARENGVIVSPDGSQDARVKLVRQPDVGQSAVYQYIMQRSVTTDKRLVVTASGLILSNGQEVYPATATYIIDRDDEPEATVTVADKRANVEVHAIADDDTKRVRLVRENLTYDPSSTGTDVSVTKSKTWTIAMGQAAEETLAVEATKDPTGAAGWREVWRQKVSGATGDTKTSSIRLSVNEVLSGTSVVSYDLTLQVTPAAATVVATINGTPKALTDGSTDAGTDTKTYTCSVPVTEDSQRFVATASSTGWIPSTATFVMDGDDEPEVDSVSVADRQDPIVITAYADDDAKALRFVHVNGQTRTYFPSASGYDTSTVKSRTWTIDILDDEEQMWAIEVRGRTGGPFATWREVWSQKVKGPSLGQTPAASLTVIPKDPTATYMDVEWITATDDEVYITGTTGLVLVAQSGSLGNTTNPASDAGIVRATRPAVGSNPAVLTFKALRRQNPADIYSPVVSVVTNTVDIAPQGGTFVAPDLSVVLDVANSTKDQAVYVVSATNPLNGDNEVVTVLYQGVTGVKNMAGDVAIASGTTVPSNTSVVIPRSSHMTAAGNVTFEASLTYGSLVLRERVTITIDPVQRDSLSCTIQILSVTEVSSGVFDVAVKATPSDAATTVTAAVNNGSPLTPQASTPSTGNYTFRMARGLADQRLVITATRANHQPASIAYTIDRDNIPGCEVTIQNYRARPLLTAVMDDDASYLRLREAGQGTDLATQVRSTSTTMTFTQGSDLAPGAERKLQIDASKDGTNWVTAVWRGSFFGANGGPVITLTPSTSATAVTISWAAGAGCTLAITMAGVQSSNYTAGNSTSPTGTVVATRPNEGLAPGVVTFTVTKDGVSTSQTVTVPPLARDSVPPKMTIDLVRNNAKTSAQQTLMSQLGMSASWSDVTETRLHIRAENLSGPGIKLETAIGTNAFAVARGPNNALQDFDSNSGTSVAETIVQAKPSSIFTSFHDRVIRFRATQQGANQNNLVYESTFTADFDSIPEVADLRFEPYPIAGAQTGWTVYGTADDDCESVAISFENVQGNVHNLSMDPATPATTLNTLMGSVDPMANKQFSFRVTQSPGGQGNVVVTPYSGGNATGGAGLPRKVTLVRPPITTAHVEDGTDGTVNVVFTTNPANIPVSYSLAGYKSQIPSGQWSGTADRLVKLARPPKTTNLPLIVEYYATSGGVKEATQRLAIDNDDIANVSVGVTSPTNNRLEVNVGFDDDTAGYRVYARKGAPPSLNPDFLRFEGDRNTPRRGMYGSAGTWYVEVVGINWAGAVGPVASGSVSVAGAAGGAAPTSGLMLNSVTASRQGGNIVVDWTVNSPQNANLEATISYTTSDNPNPVSMGVSQIGSIALNPSFQAGGVYRTYYFTVTLTNNPNSSMTASYGDYVLGTNGSTTNDSYSE